MIEKKPIDLRAAHLIPERIKKYAFDIFDKRQHSPKMDRIVPQCQVISAFVYCAEELLKKDPMESVYFGKTRSLPGPLAGLEALAAGNADWKKIRISTSGKKVYDYGDYEEKFPYFWTYFQDNNFTSLKQTLQALLKDHPLIDLLSPEKDVEHYIILEPQIAENPNLRVTYEDPFYPRKMTSKGYYDLFNYQLLQNLNDRYSLRSVFVVENSWFAKHLEEEIHNGELNYLFEMIQFYWEPQEFSKYWTQFTSMKEVCKGSRVGTHPAGDAVVTAPVGGFIIPEFSDWSLLANRGIYIFKLWENDQEKTVTQLMRVAAAIIRDAGINTTEKMHFVIMSEKTSQTVSENKIDYWSLDELFTKAEISSYKIPKGLMEAYESYHRKHGPQHLNPYVIEPVLRRKSWTLITGEEGTGKSYLAMILGAALAAGGDLFLDWSIRRRKCKTVYVVDDEMEGDIIRDRKLILDKIYPGNTENFYIHPVHRLNLISDEGKEFVRNLLIEDGTRGDASSGAVEVLILDHLLKLTGNHGDEEENWVQLRDWIEGEICKQGVSVILLHHEYAGSRMMGSKIIANDAPARIHLSPIDSKDEDHINFSISVVKNRGGRSFRKEKTVTLEMKPKPRILKEVEENDQTTTTEIPFRKLKLEEKIRLISEYRETMSQKEIAAKLGCSLSSIQKVVTKIRRSGI